MSPRSRGATSRHDPNVSSAAVSAALASSTVASATATSVSPVDGSSTSSVEPSPASRHSPPMNSWVLTASRIDFSAVALMPSTLPAARARGLQNLAEANVVAVGVQERAVDDAVGLLGRLLLDLGAGVLDVVERSLAVGDREDQRAGLVLVAAGDVGRVHEVDLQLGLLGGADSQPAHADAVHDDVGADLEAEHADVEVDRRVLVGRGEERVGEGDVVHGRTVRPPRRPGFSETAQVATVSTPSSAMRTSIE